jgi:hypothetical protein
VRRVDRNSRHQVRPLLEHQGQFRYRQLVFAGTVIGQTQIDASFHKVRLGLKHVLKTGDGLRKAAGPQVFLRRPKALS